MAGHLTANQPRGYIGGITEGLIILLKNPPEKVGIALSILNAQLPVIAATVFSHRSGVE